MIGSLFKKAQKTHPVLLILKSPSTKQQPPLFWAICVICIEVLFAQLNFHHKSFSFSFLSESIAKPLSILWGEENIFVFPFFVHGDKTTEDFHS